MPNLQVDAQLNATAQPVKDPQGNVSGLFLSTGDVGVGTAAPRRRLHVSDTAPADANDAQVEISEEAGRKALYLGRTTGYAFVQSHNSQPLALNPLGNDVGIGTTAPTHTLHVKGSVRVEDDVILDGADCAEEFDVEVAPEGRLDPGTVMVIGPEQRLRQCSVPYDRRVAGVLSGAGDRRPGIVLGRRSGPGAPGRLPIALAGTVHCHVDATEEPIEAGDLLTTSPRPGCAMRATDHARSFGAVLGKALDGLAAGIGTIPVLVSLH